MGGARIGRLLRGQQGDAAVKTLGNLLTLCAHAQRRTARMALWAAAHQDRAPANPNATLLLQLETARDHLRSMALDWPRRLGKTGNIGLKWLAGCPLPLVAPTRTAEPDEAVQQVVQLQAWLESDILQMPVLRWFDEYRDSDAFAAWCSAPAQTAVPLECLAAWQAAAQKLRPETRTLDLLDTDTKLQDERLRAIAEDLAQNPDFAQRPQWLGACAETGVWSRLRHRETATTSHTALSRLQSRWLELLELTHLSVNHQSTLLQSGALPLGPGQAIAWCEMARGLLLHWVQLDEQQRVLDYRVLAPTEWNFHPEGGLARALAELDPADADCADYLGLAYDPCVECCIQLEEIHHA